MSISRLFAQNGISKKAGTFILAGFVALSGSAAVLYAHADLSGQWKLNEQKSELGQYGARMAARSLKLTGEADAITLERKSTTPNGEDRTTTEKLTFDGKETESTLFGNSKKKSTAKWSDDGQSLVVNSTILLDRNGQTSEIKVTETYKLADNGQTLTVETNSTSQWGNNSMKLVYEKDK